MRPIELAMLVQRMDDYVAIKNSGKTEAYCHRDLVRDWFRFNVPHCPERCDCSYDYATTGGGWTVEPVRVPPHLEQEVRYWLDAIDDGS